MSTSERSGGSAREAEGRDRPIVESEETGRHRLRIMDGQLRILERERQKFSALVNNTDAGFLTLDRSLKVTWANAAAKRFRASDDAAPLGGQPCHRILCHREATCEACPAARPFKTGEVAKQELRLPGEGQSRIIVATAVPIRSLLGDVEETIVMLQDMSDLEALRQSREELVKDIEERKRTEEALRQSQDQLRQAQKMEAIGRLAGGVAHDFNNLLTIITGRCDLLLVGQDQANALSGEIGVIRDAAKRAAALTRQLLAFSRKQVLQPEILDLNEVVGNLERMLCLAIGDSIEMRSVLRPGLGQVKADPGQIEQIILNIVINARDAMPEGGKIVIETADVHLDEGYRAKHPVAGTGPYVMLAISDTGCGMDEETRSRVFEPFFTTKEQGKGTGLGLSTVYGIVKQSGGQVWVYSEPGRGSTFKVYLPRVSGAQRPVSDTAEHRSLRGSETILIVEDEPVVRALVLEILTRQGYEVLEAQDGAQARMLCERHGGAIDLLLTDVVMPRMNGRELAESLRDQRPQMRVLYMSGYTDDAVVLHGILQEGANFLEKPFRPDSLARKVREVLEAA